MESRRRLKQRIAELEQQNEDLLEVIDNISALTRDITVDEDDADDSSNEE